MTPARLTDLLKHHDWADAAARVVAEPEQFGRLEEGRRDSAVAAEIARFQGMAEQRLGEEGVRAALHSVRDGAVRSQCPVSDPEQH